MPCERIWPILVSILNKALASIPEAEQSSFQDRWVNIRVESRVDWETVWWVSLAILLVAGTVLAVILRSNRKLALEVRERTMAEQKIQAMSSAMHDALIMIDGQARIMYWNHAAEVLFGIPVGRCHGPGHAFS